MPSGNQCQNCAHFYGSQACEAYPEAIPEKFITAEADHDAEQPDQVPGFIFEPVEAENRKPLALSAN